MKLTSGTLAKYNEGIIANNRSWSVRIKYYKDGSWRTLSNTKTASLTMSDYTIDGKNITMGSVVGGKLEFKVKGIGGTEFENGTKVKFELRLDSSSVTLTSKPYVVDEMNLLKKTDGLYDGTITAYDITYLMNKTYTPTANELFANEIVEAIANKYNLGIDDSVYDAIYAVDGDDWVVYTIIPDFTEKQTLGYMAGCYGCYAYVTEDENIAFGWYTDGGKSIAKNDVYEDGATVSEASPRTYKMIESGTKETPLVYPSQAIGHSINFENPYITASQVEAIYNTKVANDKVTFSVAKVKYRGDPLNGGAGSILKARQANGQITMFVMKRTLYYDGGVYEVIESLGESESTISYKVASPTQQRIDRALSRMEEAIKNATDVITQTKGSVFELIPIDENDPSKGNSGWKLYSTQIGNKNLILANSSGIGFSNDGGETFGAAAIYIDENGVGHINGNYITAGSISADKIDTSQLVVNKNNITGLDDELESLLAIAEGADDKADNAQSTANNASSVANSAQSTANTANTNASNALNKANTAATDAETAKDTLVGLCVENDLTLIDGANIYTGSIAAHSVDIDKLAAGEGGFVNILSNSMPSGSSLGNGFEGYNLDISKKTNYMLAKPKLYGNLFGDDDGEFISTTVVGGSSSSTATTGINGWTVENGTYSNYFVSQGYYFVMVFPNTSSTSSTRCSIYHSAYLENGQTYSLSAQINCNNWSAQNSTSIPFYFYVDGTISTYSASAKSGAIVSDKEMNVEFVFRYTGTTGYKNVGLTFNKMTSTRINIAWVNLTKKDSSTVRPVGFYCSEASLLNSTLSLINSGDYISSASDFRVYLSSFSTSGTDLFVALQKARLRKGKKYVLTARIKAENFAKTNSPKLAYFVGEGIIPAQQSFRSATTNDVTVQFVFKFNPTTETSTTDVGLAWTGLLESDNTPVSMRIYWMTLWEDESATEGFYCSYTNWLGSDYTSKYSLTDSSLADTYAQTYAMKVVDDNLLFWGKMFSNEGVAGCLSFSSSEAGVEGASVVYDNLTSDPLVLNGVWTTTAKFVKPPSLNDLSTLNSMTGIYDAGIKLSIGCMAHGVFEAKGNDQSVYKTIVTPIGIHVSDGTNYSYLTPTKLVVKGQTIA